MTLTVDDHRDSDENFADNNPVSGGTEDDPDDGRPQRNWLQGIQRVILIRGDLDGLGEKSTKKSPENAAPGSDHRGKYQCTFCRHLETILSTLFPALGGAGFEKLHPPPSRSKY